MALTPEEIQKIIAEEEAKYVAAEADARRDRMAGTRCFCCDAPLPAERSAAGITECAECADIDI